MQPIIEDDIHLFRCAIEIVDYKTINNVYIIKVGHMDFIMTYGKKFSSNFFVNVWYLLTIGTCREIQCKRMGDFCLSTKISGYVRSERIAKNSFPFFKHQIISSLKEEINKKPFLLN